MRKIMKPIFALSLYLWLLCYWLLLSNKKSSTGLEEIDSFHNMVSIPYQLSSCDTFIYKSTPREECGCRSTENRVPQLQSELNVKCSMCSDEANVLGPGQQVFSYTFFKSTYRTRGTKDPKTDYYGGINRNLEAMREFYPGWVMRIYSNLTLTQGDEACNLICNNQEDFYWCDVSKIKYPGHPAVSAKQLHGWFWRFFPMIDPLVSIFLSRDLDSVLGMRERNAVRQWEWRMDKAIHLMRDNPTGHNFSVMAGMWGMKNDDALITPRKRKEVLTKLMELSPIEHPEVDQYALDKVVYSKDYFQVILTHDSFFCEVFNKTECIPFPDGGWTLGDKISFVGKPVMESTHN